MLKKTLSKHPTLYALGAIFLWATQAFVLAKELADLDLLVFLTLSFFFSFIFFSLQFIIGFKNFSFSHTINLGLDKSLTLFKNQYTYYGIGGYFLYHFFLFKAIDLGPVVIVNLLNFCWPVIFWFLIQRFFPKDRLNKLDSGLLYLKSVIAVIGCVILIFVGNSIELSFDFFSDNFMGHILGIGAAIVWAFFSIAVKKYEVVEKIKTTAVSWAIFALFAGVLSGCFLLLKYIFISRSLNVLDFKRALWPSLYFGIFPLGFAMALYNRALHKSKPDVLCRLVFLTPLLSTLFLFLFVVHEPLSLRVYLGATLIVVANMRWRFLFNGAKIQLKLIKRHQRLSLKHSNGRKIYPIFILPRIKKIYNGFKGNSIKNGKFKSHLQEPSQEILPTEATGSFSYDEKLAVSREERII